jgi:hypothetical protein
MGGVMINAILLSLSLNIYKNHPSNLWEIKMYIIVKLVDNLYYFF